MNMFCYQCEQTARGTGCTTVGVCGKDAATAAMQDLLVRLCKEIAYFSVEDRADPEIDQFLFDALFTTVTNVDFDARHIAAVIYQGAAIRDRLANRKRLNLDPIPIPSDYEHLLKTARRVSFERRRDELGQTAAGLQELILYGLKGAASYAHHAWRLGRSEDDINREFCRILALLATNPTLTESLLGEALHVGALNYRVMELLDLANTNTFGNPRPTPVRITPLAGKCILVSGHDLLDLDLLLRQTEGMGINIYTHGEMLPAHGYPKLRRYPHLAGNYGGAWQLQRDEFNAFPGAILMTTNCIQEPKEGYRDRLFTSGPVHWPGVTHIPEDQDFSPVIDAALAADGFPKDAPEQTITVGYGRHAVDEIEGQLIAAVRSGAIRHFFLIGGCDGAKPGRNYYTEFAKAVPNDCIILTLACGKYRFNKLDFGEIAGIPRLLDIGQCNDAFSAVQIAVGLAEAFDGRPNDLPLSLILSWYEQKAVAILLTMLHLGLRGIRLGPSVPAFITPEVLNILTDKYDIKPITTVDEDLAAALAPPTTVARRV